MRTELISLLALLWSWSWNLVAAHTVLTYPGWRGNNLHDNVTFPYGMQWMYPCTSSSWSPVLLGRYRSFWGTSCRCRSKVGGSTSLTMLPVAVQVVECP